MTTQARKTILATIGLVALFAIYETVKTILFPGMSVVTSHMISTVVVGIITIVIGQYVVSQQTSLLDEREQNNRRLREALIKSNRDENLLRSIVDSIDEGLIIIDRESNVLLINDAARRLLNIGQQTKLTRLTDISRDPLIHRLFAEVLSNGDQVEGRLESRHRDPATQNRRIMRLHAVPLRLTGGQVDGVVGALIDISKVEMLERVRQEFLSNVSHELRTPLAAIIAFVETLLDGGLEDPDNCLRFLNTIHRNASRMRALVSDISELSSIESGATRLTLVRIPLQTMVNEVFSGLAPRASAYGVRLDNLVESEFHLVADRRRLEQILINLVDNAIKFNHPGGSVTVSVEMAVPGGTDLNHVIRVRDTGPGIAIEHLPRVFERFYRVDKARSRDAGGTGLGLAIVKHLVLIHGGEAEVQSEVGAGSEFIVRLPANPVETAVSSFAESGTLQELI
jgi:two-component system, OmpR family, phosphate regulon sensor histidine kinase PhoR